MDRLLTDCMRIATQKINKSVKYVFTPESLEAYRKIPISSAELLEVMIEKVRKSDDIFLKGTYKDFGFKYKQHFHRDKTKLIEAGFLLHEDGWYVIDNAFVEYMTRKKFSALLSKRLIKTSAFTAEFKE